MGIGAALMAAGVLVYFTVDEGKKIVCVWSKQALDEGTN
jgi:hypothetical protein